MIGFVRVIIEIFFFCFIDSCLVPHGGKMYHKLGDFGILCLIPVIRICPLGVEAPCCQLYKVPIQCDCSTTVDLNVTLDSC